MTVNVVLVHPQIPQNTGNIARTCAATGARLHLVKPFGFELDDAKMKRAGLDYWNKLNVSVYDSFDDFSDEASKNSEDGIPEYRFFETRQCRNYCNVEYADNTYLVFGREDKGLPAELLSVYAEQCVQIPMRAGLRSLNMSNSVAVGVYEVLRQWGFPKLS